MADVRIRKCSPGAGLAWMRTGLRLFWRQPLVLSVLVALGPLFLFSLWVVPIAGTAAMLILGPSVTMGMLNACRSVEEDRMPGVSGYFSAYADRSTGLNLIKIGVFAALVVGVLQTVLLLFPEDARAPREEAASVSASPVAGSAGTPGTGAAPAPGAANATPPPTAPAAGPGLPVTGDTEIPLTPARVAVVVLYLAVSVPLQMALLFAPALVAWHRMPAFKALFFSFFACWRNLVPIVLMSLALLGLLLLVLFLGAAILKMLNAQDSLVPYLLGPVVFAFLAVVQSAVLSMLREVVEDDAQTTVAPPPQNP